MNLLAIRRSKTSTRSDRLKILAPPVQQASRTTYSRQYNSDDFWRRLATVRTVMTFVTKLTLQSGDRAVLDRVVREIASVIERKGAEMKGPHPSPPETLRVPQHKRTTGGETFGSWSYTVYTRTIEIHGHDAAARLVMDREFPEGIHLGVEVEQVRPMGSS